jgi:hypothetical protein
LHLVIDALTDLVGVAAGVSVRAIQSSRSSGLSWTESLSITAPASLIKWGDVTCCVCAAVARVAQPFQTIGSSAILGLGRRSCR